MMTSMLTAFVIFGVLFAICLIGLIKSDASATRLTSSNHDRFGATGREDPSRMPGTVMPGTVRQSGTGRI